MVFRTGEGTKLALSGNPVAFEVDGYDPETNRAWSAVINGAAEMPQNTDDIIETVMRACVRARRTRIGETSI